MKCTLLAPCSLLQCCREVRYSQSVVGDRAANAEHHCYGRRPPALPLPRSAFGTPPFENTRVAELCACLSGNFPAKLQKSFIDGGQQGAFA